MGNIPLPHFILDNSSLLVQLIDWSLFMGETEV